MSESKKTVYNQTYYQRNREKILARAKAKKKNPEKSESNVISLFKPENKRSNFSRRNFRIQLPWKSLLLGLLVLSMTYYLISEAVRFYAATEGNLWEAWLKALILEGAVVAFSVSKSKTRMLSWATKLLIVAISCYTFWLVSGSIIQDTYEKQRELALLEKSAKELEEQISKVQETQVKLLKSDRVSLVRKYDFALSELKNRLEEKRKLILKIPETSSIWNTLGTLLCFRLLVMLSNLRCLALLKSSSRRWSCGI